MPTNYQILVNHMANLLEKQPLSRHLVHQDNRAKYHYDHTHPTDIETDVAWTWLKKTGSNLQVRSYGEQKGVWYWDHHLGDWVNPPKKEWTDV